LAADQHLEKLASLKGGGSSSGCKGWWNGLDNGCQLKIMLSGVAFICVAVSAARPASIELLPSGD
jgi:hypothetical protein